MTPVNIIFPCVRMISKSWPAGSHHEERGIKCEAVVQYSPVQQYVQCLLDTVLGDGTNLNET